jgi:virginiamycin A acetyltransferase
LDEESKNKLKQSIVTPESKTIIGNDVWIGMNVIILPNVKIGNGATILAGSVVSKDVPDYAVVGGIPGTVIKMKYNPETISKLQQIAWWNWEPKKVEENVQDFYHPIQEFINKWYS